MKLTIKLNIEEFQNIDFETNEYDNIANCYAEVSDFLGDWVEYTANAVKLKAHIEALGIVSMLKEEGESSVSPIMDKTKLSSEGVSRQSSDLRGSVKALRLLQQGTDHPTDSNPLKSKIDWITYEGRKYKDCKFCEHLVSWNHDTNNYDHFNRGFKYLYPKCNQEGS